MPERGTKTSTVPVVWANLEFFRRDTNDFLSGAIGDHGRKLAISLWPGVAPQRLTPAQKKSECKNPLEKFSHPPRWLSSKGPNYQRGELLISAGAIEGHFEGQTQREVQQGGLVLVRHCPGSPGTCISEETGLPGLPMSSSPTLFSEPSPVGLPPLPWTGKIIDRSPLFIRQEGHCCRGDLFGRTIFWFFFEWLAKVGTTG